MAKLFGEYVQEAEYNAFMKLLELTRELGHQISTKEAIAKHEEDDNFPTPNAIARCMAFSDFSDAASKAYTIYKRELPDDDEEEEEPITESEPQEEYTLADTECDPFDEGPDSILEAGLPVHELNTPDNGEGPSEPEEDENDDSTVKIYVNDKRSQIVLPPTVSLVNYLFNCLVRVPDLGSKNEYFYAEDTGFYAEASEPDNKITETKYFASSSIEGSCNLFVVKRPNPPILEIVSQGYDEQIRIPFPGPRKDICYIVSRPFAEAARAAGRTTDDLIYIEEYERITGTKYNEILVKEFRGL